MQISNELLRLAMWSGPRNISTALMRAWENRDDTVVIDEPFYACYLQTTRADHPGAAEVIAHGEVEWRKVVDRLTIENFSPSRVFYQKQMTHHLLPEISRDWLKDVTNCFLIRDPAEVIASYMRKNHEPTMADLGFAQQLEIFDFVRDELGQNPPVIDAADVLRDPERMLRLLCETVGVEFSAKMLAWPPGPRASDGIWAKHWYAEVERSTSFARSPARQVTLPAALHELEEHARAIYEKLHSRRLK